MEISSALNKSNHQAAWLDKSHPNYNRWERARKLSVERGRIVKTLLEKYRTITNKNILDIGSGEGGTSSVFSENNFVISVDLSLLRLQRQKANFQIKNSVNSNALKLPFSDSSFDIIILQDVIEHLSDSENFLYEIKRVLKSNGIIYLSTPNKFSIINILSDPHWGLPLVAVFKRETIRNIFLKYFRKSELNRKDLAELISLNKILKMFSDEFEIRLQTKKVVENLFSNSDGIVWSNFHLSLIRALKKFSLDKFIIKIANDNLGMINKFFTPTFYLVMKRKSV
uniref:Class I SAM-dependent methyltransferase n=1 Tax=Ignavibacterium album TaxID=591197 RepID=A0A832DLW3_9BACT